MTGKDRDKLRALLYNNPPEDLMELIETLLEKEYDCGYDMGYEEASEDAMFN